jgi:hypothetical protein
MFGAGCDFVPVGCITAAVGATLLCIPNINGVRVKMMLVFDAGRVLRDDVVCPF